MRVRVKATGEVITIDADEFDEELHERCETPKGGSGLERTVGEMDAADLMKGIGDAVVTGFKGVLADLGAGVPDRSRLAGLPDPGSADRKPALEGARLNRADIVRYRTIPQWEKDIGRSAETDHWIKRWVVSEVTGDIAGMREAMDHDVALTDAEKRDYGRALSVGTATAGGNLVPTILSSMLIEKARKMQVIGPRASEVVDDSIEILELPVEGTLMTASQVAENAQATEADPSVNQVTLTKQNIIAATRSSRQLLAASPFALTNILSRQGSKAIALQADAQDMQNGNGTPPNQTEAIGQNAKAAQDAAVGAFAYTDMTNLFYALAAEYRLGAVWIANNALIKILADELDTNGKPIFVGADERPLAIDGGQGGAPGVGFILGRPILEQPDVPAGELFLVNLEDAYGILTDTGILAESSTTGGGSASTVDAFLSHQILWKFVQRRDGAVTNADAFVWSGGITA